MGIGPGTGAMCVGLYKYGWLAATWGGVPRLCCCPYSSLCETAHSSLCETHGAAYAERARPASVGACDTAASGRNRNRWSSGSEPAVRTVHARTYVLSMHRAPPNGRQPPTLLPIPGHPPGASQRVVGIPAHASPQSPYPPILAAFGASRDGRRRPQRPRAPRMPDEFGKRPTRLPPKQRGRAYPTLGYPQKGATPGRHTPGPPARLPVRLAYPARTTSPNGVNP